MIDKQKPEGSAESAAAAAAENAPENNTEVEALREKLRAYERAEEEQRLMGDAHGDAYRRWHDEIHQLADYANARGRAITLTAAFHAVLIEHLDELLNEAAARAEREALAQDGHFLYTVLRAKKGTMPPLTPGQQYATPQLLAEGGPLLGAYLARIEAALACTVRGLQKASEPEKLRYYQTALAEIQEMRKHHDDCP